MHAADIRSWKANDVLFCYLSSFNCIWFEQRLSETHARTRTPFNTFSTHGLKQETAHVVNTHTVVHHTATSRHQKVRACLKETLARRSCWQRSLRGAAGSASPPLGPIIPWSVHRAIVRVSFMITGLLKRRRRPVWGMFSHSFACCRFLELSGGRLLALWGNFPERGRGKSAPAWTPENKETCFILTN